MSLLPGLELLMSTTLRSMASANEDERMIFLRYTFTACHQVHLCLLIVQVLFPSRQSEQPGERVMSARQRKVAYRMPELGSAVCTTYFRSETIIMLCLLLMCRQCRWEAEDSAAAGEYCPDGLLSTAQFRRMWKKLGIGQVSIQCLLARLCVIRKRICRRNNGF